MVNLVYEFEYDGERRVAVMLTEKKSAWSSDVSYTAHDFLKDGFRTFARSKMKNLKLVSDYKVFELNEDLVDRYKDAGAKVFEHLDLDIMFVVVLK